MSKSTVKRSRNKIANDYEKAIFPNRNIDRNQPQQ